MLTNSGQHGSQGSAVLWRIHFLHVMKGSHASTMAHLRTSTADMPSGPHLEGQTCILASQPALSCSKFELALME